MAAFKTGDLCTLISGSPRMAVESVDNEGVHVVWCNEGVIQRDTFAAPLLRPWEAREDDRAAGGKPGRGEREGGGRKFDPRDAGTTGRDGRKRQKTHFRKD